MSYMKLGNYQIRENGHKRSIFDKTNEIKSELKKLFPEVESDGWISIFSHVRNYYRGNLHYGRRNSKNKKPRELTPIERQVYDYMMKKELNPCTTYRWFLATRIPEDIKTKLAQGKISHKRALLIASNRKSNADSNRGLLMLEELRTIFRGL